MIMVVGKIFTFNTFTSSEGDYSNVTNLFVILLEVILVFAYGSIPKVLLVLMTLLLYFNAKCIS